MIGITGFGGYLPRLRLLRRAITQANAWYAPGMTHRGGTRTMANWDEDSLTMAVAAARDCLGQAQDRSQVRSLFLASNTLPFQERLNAGIVAGALNLDEEIDAVDLGGAQRSALSAVLQALDRVKARPGDALVLAADARKARAASVQELDYGDAAAAMLVGRDRVLAEFLGAGSLSVDFVDHFRAAGESIDYHWEERWVRDEGIGKLVPRAIAAALQQAQVQASQVDHLIFPSSFARMDVQLAKACGIRAEAVVEALMDSIGDSGLPHGLLMLSHVLERAQPGQLIVVAQFGSGAQALVFRVTEAIRTFKPQRGVSEWLARGVEEDNYTKFLAFKGQLELERGMRGEQDKKTALSTAWRHRQALLGFVAGRCEVTGSVHFPPSRLSYDQGKPLQDTQRPYPLADRPARILSWSAEYLSYHAAPPHHYGQIDFDGGGRILMDFTDLEVGDVDSGTAMEMVFRIKDVDERRHFTRYFWKATPVRVPDSLKGDAHG
jgi:3-hydroxy-3-methylglutaryl CoA synthase